MPVTDADLALCPPAIRARYLADPGRYEAVVLKTAAQRAGRVVPIGTTSEPAPPPSVPWVGAFASDGEALDAANACPYKCRTCKATKCRGGLRDGEPVTLEDCLACVRRPTAPDRGHGTLPVPMVAPGDRREGVWFGGVLQIHVTRACDLACVHCTQGSNLAGKPVVMHPDDFEQAVRSLDGYFGVVGMFGGNPALHPQFDTLCEILRAHVPWERRGIWCNHPRGKGRAMRVTFNPAVSNLNVHLSAEARDEFSRDWPESTPYLKGHDRDSEHSSPWVALRDVVPDEAERWEMIRGCDVNAHWSALIGVVPGRGLQAYFCELAYSQAAMHGEAWPDTGLEVEPGWWRRPMADFEAQVRQHCHACGIPLRRAGKLAMGGGAEECTATHADIVRPKVKHRDVVMVESIGVVDRTRPATEYLPGTTPGYRP